MHIILCHENADFDALAAMLAAHKLDPAAIPVLPNRLNHNVDRVLHALPIRPALRHSR